MAPLDTLDLRDSLVKVTLAGRGSKPFSIHSELLPVNGTSLEFMKLDDGDIWIPYDADIKISAFHTFARFLYTGQVTRNANGSADNMDAAIAELVQAYRCGDKIHAVQFMDAVVDEIIKMVTSRPNPCCINTLVRKLLADMPEDSKLFDFVCDYVLYFRDVGCGEEGCSIYHELRSVEDGIFLHYLGTRASHERGLKDSTETTEHSIMLAVGCREAMKHDDWYEVDEYSWKQDKCRYHEHTFWKKECYALKRNGDPDHVE